jgi:hypothetical protein
LKTPLFRDVMTQSVLFVIEGLVVHPPRDLVRIAAQWSRKLERLCASIPMDARMTAHLWNIEWHSSFRVELATLHSEPFANAMEKRFLRDHVPGEVRWATNAALLRSYVDGPTVFRAYHNLPGLDLGAKSERIEEPELFALD